MNSVIELTALTKTFGKSRGVSNISLKVPKGTIYGFLGPNGAGKSTTINMIMGLSSPTSGEIRVLGKDIKSHGIETRINIGFLSSDMSLDGHLTGWQQLEYFGQLRGDFNKKYIEELANRFDCNLSRKQKTLSRGNRQKVALIQALMHRPKLLILDEPTSGLDPLVQAEFNQTILEHRASGNSTFISSHVLSEVQELCDHVAFIREGKLVVDTTVKTLIKSAPKQVRLGSTDPKLIKALEKLPGVANLTTTRHRCNFTYKGESNTLIKTMGMFDISDVSVEDADLESTFLSFYEEKENV